MQPDQSNTENNHQWPFGTCKIVGDSIVPGTDERCFWKKNRLVKLRDFRGARINDLKHHHIMQKEPDSIFLHVGTNDGASDTGRQILDDLLQLKNFILNTISNSKVIIFKPAMHLDNGKPAITFRNLIEHLSQLEVDCIDN